MRAYVELVRSGDHESCLKRKNDEIRREENSE